MEKVFSIINNNYYLLFIYFTVYVLSGSIYNEVNTKLDKLFQQCKQNIVIGMSYCCLQVFCQLTTRYIRFHLQISILTNRVPQVDLGLGNFDILK